MISIYCVLLASTDKPLTVEAWYNILIIYICSNISILVERRSMRFGTYEPSTFQVHPLCAFLYSGKWSPAPWNIKGHLSGKTSCW